MCSDFFTVTGLVKITVRGLGSDESSNNNNNIAQQRHKKQIRIRHRTDWQPQPLIRHFKLNLLCSIIILIIVNITAIDNTQKKMAFALR